MSCPNCQCDDWKLASLVYKEGLTESKADTTITGVGLSSSGIGVGTARSKTNETHQTELSKQAAPNLGIDFSGISIILSGFFFCFGFLHSKWWFLAFVAFFLFGCSPYASTKKNNEELGKWINRRMCTRCGVFYDPVE